MRDIQNIEALAAAAIETACKDYVRALKQLNVNGICIYDVLQAKKDAINKNYQDKLDKHTDYIVLINSRCNELGLLYSSYSKYYKALEEKQSCEDFFLGDVFLFYAGLCNLNVSGEEIIKALYQKVFGKR